MPCRELDRVGPRLSPRWRDVRQASTKEDEGDPGGALVRRERVPDHQRREVLPRRLRPLPFQIPLPGRNRR